MHASAPHPPPDPVAAATHADPYPYYATLAADRPFHRDERLGMWIATGAAAVSAVLAHPSCRVRPPGEPVPRAITGSPAGEIFRHLVRMNDGEAHRPLRRAVSATLGTLDPATIAEMAARSSRRLIGTWTDRPGAMLTDFMFALPVHVVGTMLGFGDDDLHEITRLLGDYVRCIAPASTREEVAAGNRAAAVLLSRVQALMRECREPPSHAAHLSAEARGCGPGELAASANAVGLMVQSYDATAGLIGNTLVALARDPILCAQAADDPTLLEGVIDEVLRFDPPIHNTRRYLAEPATIAGETLSAGDAVLVVLAAANRDPRLNADPHRFDTGRKDRRTFAFGAGAHACPGRSLATTITRAAVATLLASGLDPARIDPAPRYRPSANARVPLLAWRRDGKASTETPREAA